MDARRFFQFTLPLPSAKTCDLGISMGYNRVKFKMRRGSGRGRKFCENNVFQYFDHTLVIIYRRDNASILDQDWCHRLPVVRKNWISMPCKGFLPFSHIAAWLTPPWTSALEVATISL